MTNLKLFGAALILLLWSSCKGQNSAQCKYVILEKTEVKLKNADSLCKKLNSYEKNGTEFFFYISEDIPDNLNKIALPLLRNDRKAAILFLDPKAGDFTTIYNDSLKVDGETLNRNNFRRFVHEKLKEPRTESFYFEVADTFNSIFGNRQYKGF
jgi:hypothetical protein